MQRHKRSLKAMGGGGPSIMDYTGLSDSGGDTKPPPRKRRLHRRRTESGTTRPARKKIVIMEDLCTELGKALLKKFLSQLEGDKFIRRVEVLIEVSIS